MNDRQGSGSHRFETTGIDPDIVITRGCTGDGQGIDLAKVGMHVERTALTRQIAYRQLEEVARITELDATTIDVQVGDATVTDHHPARVAIDVQLADVVEPAGQSRLVLQGDVGRCPGIRDHIADQMAVIHGQVGGRCAIDLQDAPVATDQGGSFIHFDRGQDRRQAKVIDDDRRAGLTFYSCAVERQTPGVSNIPAEYKANPDITATNGTGRSRGGAIG
ncbi:hypothetical protein D3C85_668120 [compost metagenome]